MNRVHECINNRPIVEKAPECEQMLIFHHGDKRVADIIDRLNELSEGGKFMQYREIGIIDCPIDSGDGEFKKTWGKARIRLERYTNQDGQEVLTASFTVKRPVTEADAFRDSFRRLHDILNNDFDTEYQRQRVECLKKQYLIDRSFTDVNEFSIDIPVEEMSDWKESDICTHCFHWIKKHQEIIVKGLAHQGFFTSPVSDGSARAFLDDTILQVSKMNIRNRLNYYLSSGEVISIERGKHSGEEKIEVEGKNHGDIQVIIEKILGLSQPMSVQVLSEIIQKETQSDVVATLENHVKITQSSFQERALERLRHLSIHLSSEANNVTRFIYDKYLEDDHLSHKTRKIERLFGVYYPVLETYFLNQINSIANKSWREYGGQVDITIHKIYHKLDYIFAIFGEKLEVDTLKKLLQVETGVLKKMYRQIEAIFLQVNGSLVEEKSLRMFMRSFRIAIIQKPDLSLESGLQVFFSMNIEHVKDAARHLYILICKQLSDKSKGLHDPMIAGRMCELVRVHHFCCEHLGCNENIKSFLDTSLKDLQTSKGFDILTWEAYARSLSTLSLALGFTENKNNFDASHKDTLEYLCDQTAKLRHAQETRNRGVFSKKIFGTKSASFDNTKKSLASTDIETIQKGIHQLAHDWSRYTFRADLQILDILIAPDDTGKLHFSDAFYELFGLPSGSQLKITPKIAEFIKRSIDSRSYIPKGKDQDIEKTVFNQFLSLQQELYQYSDLGEFLIRHTNSVFLIQALVEVAVGSYKELEVPVGENGGTMLNSFLKLLNTHNTSNIHEMVHINERPSIVTDKVLAIDYEIYDKSLFHYPYVHNEKYSIPNKDIYILSHQPVINTLYLKVIALEILGQLLAQTPLQFTLPLEKSIFNLKIENIKKGNHRPPTYSEYLAAFTQYKKILRSHGIVDKNGIMAAVDENRELRRFIKFAYFCARNLQNLWYDPDHDSNILIEDLTNMRDDSTYLEKVFKKEYYRGLPGLIVPDKKGYARCIEKTISKCDGNVSQLGDVFRASIIVSDFSSTPMAVYDLMIFFRQKYGKKIRSFSFEDQIQNPLSKLTGNKGKSSNPSGFRNATLAIELTDGSMVEIQVVTKAYHALKTEGVSLEGNIGFIDQLKKHQLLLNSHDIDILHECFMDSESLQLDARYFHSGFLQICTPEAREKLSEYISVNKHGQNTQISTDDLYHIYRSPVMLKNAEVCHKLQAIENMLYELVHGEILASEWHTISDKKVTY